MKWHKSGTFHRATAPHGHASIIEHGYKKWSATITAFSPKFQTKKEAVEWSELMLQRTADSPSNSQKRMMEG